MNALYPRDGGYQGNDHFHGAIRPSSQARKIGHPHTLAFALTGAIAMQWFLCNRGGIDRYVDELGPISYENGFIFFIGHVLIYQGEIEEGLKAVEEGLGFKALLSELS